MYDWLTTVRGVVGDNRPVPQPLGFGTVIRAKGKPHLMRVSVTGGRVVARRSELFFRNPRHL
ncbi:MAG: hypothetical protein O7G29_06885 [Acidobacteria bacterium]|nr:hypothetical protein [Acidobacteriota bacterium]